ncbi:OmpA/MotB domain protein [Bacteroides heparinolyticus]|uniref:OmpA/MotB domain protein n=1 Tax=Prevotella heparinolytica TaxID=28113 RepID=A0A449I6U3_9BACE|nr:OmpA family protein [Bacteroides heparinolyticus]VFB15142.1 OmpA/MotB domain protein [Bacteroides heparinolyticus]
MNYRRIVLTVLLGGAILQAYAQEVPKERTTVRRWYAGLRGGLSAGTSTFVSAAADKYRPGWSAGFFGGYRFNSVFSLEGVLKWGQVTLGIRKGDVDANYWLGRDLVRYHAPVIGIEGWNYNDLKSRVNVRSFGLQGNIDLLEIFRSGNCRWRMELSPLVSVVRTKADFVTIPDDKTVMGLESRWHIGWGGEAQIGYRVSEHWGIGIYSGFMQLAGKRLDRIPEQGYKTNLFREGGLKLTYAFGKKVKRAEALKPVEPAMPEVDALCEQPAPKEDNEPDTTKAAEPVELSKTIEHPVSEASIAPVGSAAAIDFPTVYFAFNSARISGGEEAKMQQTLRLLQDNPKLNIVVTGWCDTVGSDAVNLRLSLKRAEALKTWLTARGIDAARIKTAGKGRDFNEKNAARARRSETTKED